MSNSEPESEAEPKVKAEENFDRIVVVDPDDYQKTQKLKAINEAKSEYKKYKRQKAEILQNLEERWLNPRKEYDSERAMRLAEYGTELMPLIEEGIEKGGLTEEDMKCSLGDDFREIDIRREKVRMLSVVPLCPVYMYMSNDCISVSVTVRQGQS